MVYYLMRIIILGEQLDSEQCLVISKTRDNENSSLCLSTADMSDISELSFTAWISFASFDLVFAFRNSCAIYFSYILYTRCSEIWRCTHEIQ